MAKSITGMLTAAALVAGGAGALAVLPASAASADLVTQCVGSAGEVTVPGDLVVPAEETCVLTGTTITGDVRVRSGADLITEGVTIEGRVVGAQDAYVELVDSSVSGALTLNSAYGAVVEETAVTGQLTSRAAEDAEDGFVFATGADVSGNLVARAGEVYLEDSSVAGNLTSRGAVYTDLYGTFIDGRLVVGENTEGSMLCGTVVQGNSRITENSGAIQIGSNGPLADCDQTSYWGGVLRVDGNDGGVVIDENIVNGTLRLAENAPEALVGENNQIRGGIDGPYGDWDGTAPQARDLLGSSAVPQLAEASADHADQIQDRITERRSAAQAQAAEAGSADLG